MDRNTRILFVGYNLIMVLFLLCVLAVRGMVKLSVPALVTFPIQLVLTFLGVLMFVSSVVAIFFFIAHKIHAIGLILPIYHVLSTLFFLGLQVVGVVWMAIAGEGAFPVTDVIGGMLEVSLLMELLFAIFILYRFNTDANKIGWLARQKETSPSDG